MERLIRPYISYLQKTYTDDPDVPEEPGQAFLLGNRWADYMLCCVFALLFPVLRGFLNKYVYEPLGMRAMFGVGSSKGKAEAIDQERLQKWKESCWKATVYTLFTTVAFLVSYQEKWFWDTRYFWLGCSSFPPCNMVVTKGVLLFYCMETGFYLQAIHFLAVHETRRKDWLESMIHHVVTAGLLAYSYYVNFARVGVMVILVHDVSDIFLEAAKLGRYMKRQRMAEAFFAVFVLVWTASRVVVFPAHIIRSTLTEPLSYADLHGITAVEPHFSIFNGLLLVLLALHVYWTVLIYRILWLALRQGEARDVREEDG